MKFSILTAYYNNHKYLTQLMESIYEQSVLPDEWIIVDDGSDEENKDRLHAYHLMASMWDTKINLKLITTEHKGCGHAYHTAAKAATGDIIGVVDSDDLLTNDAVELIKLAYDTHPKIGYIYSNFHRMTKKPKASKLSNIGFASLPVKNHLESSCDRRTTFSHFRTASKRIGIKFSKLFNPERMRCVDKEMGFILEEHAYGGFLPIPLYHYRILVGMTVANFQATADVLKELHKETKTRRHLRKIYPKPTKAIAIACKYF